MELFLPFPVIGSKNLFNKNILVRSNDSKMIFRNRKWDYLNMKWNHFSPFQSSDHKTSFTKVSSFCPTIPKWFSEPGNEIISPLSSHHIKVLLLQKYLYLVERFQIGFQIWNCLNRKWNYYSHFHTPDQKTS